MAAGRGRPGARPNGDQLALIRTDLRNAGATVVDEPAVTDGNIVTSRNPDDVPAFTGGVIRLVERVSAAIRAKIRRSAA